MTGEPWLPSPRSPGVLPDKGVERARRGTPGSPRLGPWARAVLRLGVQCTPELTGGGGPGTGLSGKRWSEVCPESPSIRFQQDPQLPLLRPVSLPFLQHLLRTKHFTHISPRRLPYAGLLLHARRFVEHLVCGVSNLSVSFKFMSPMKRQRLREAQTSARVLQLVCAPGGLQARVCLSPTP